MRRMKFPCSLRQIPKCITRLLPTTHYSSPGLGTILLTSMMMSALFSPPFMGYGGYYGGPPRTVSTVQSQRSGVTSSMGSANPSQSAVTNSKGQSVGQSNFKKVPQVTESGQNSTVPFKEQCGNNKSIWRVWWRQKLASRSPSFCTPKNNA